MADTGGASAKRERKKRLENRKRLNGTVMCMSEVKCLPRTVGRKLNKWRELQEFIGFKTDPELAIFLINRYVICVYIYGIYHKS